MTTTRTITNPDERQAGDHYTIAFKDGAVLDGDARDDSGRLFVGVTVVKNGDWSIDLISSITSVTVTREVEDIAEPSGFGALVELGDGGYATHAYLHADDFRPWLVRAGGWSSWRELAKNHGGVARVVFEGVDL